MPDYELAQRYYFRQNGKTMFPGDTVDFLTEAEATEINRNEGPILKPVRLTTQAQVEAVREVHTDTPARRGRKPRAK